MRPRNGNNCAFTLPEVLIASVILAFAVSAITYAVAAGQQQSYFALHELRATALADALMEELIALPYADPDGVSIAGPDAGESGRDQFDNIDDYHGFAEAAGDVVDASGSSYPGTFATFSRGVTAVADTVAVPALGGDINGIRVTVTVADDKGMAWTVARFIPEPSP